MSDDARLEEFLRQFRSRAPGPLRRPPHRRRVVWVGLAALIVAGSVLVLEWWPLRAPLDRSTDVAAGNSEGIPTIGMLKAAIRAGNDAEVLDRLDARLLPDPRRKGSALGLLGDINRDR